MTIVLGDNLGKNKFLEINFSPPSLGFYNIVNGTSGIATAMASSIPQFNLREVNEAMIKLINIMVKHIIIIIDNK